MFKYYFSGYLGTMSKDNVSSSEGVTRRGFLSVAVSAIVAGVIAGVGAYYAGTLAAPAEVIREVTKTVERTTTITAPPTTVTVTKTETVTATAPPITVTPPPPKEKIVIGFPLSETGMLAVEAISKHLWMWALAIDYINEAGGVYVKEYGRRLPIHYIYYDDRSEIEYAIKILEKLATEDKVDLMLPPLTDALLYPAIPIFEKYSYPCLTHTNAGLPYVLVDKEYEWFYHMAPLAKTLAKNIATLLKEIDEKYVRLERIAYMHSTDPYGFLAKEGFLSALKEVGLEPVIVKGHDAALTDYTPIIKEMMRAGVDCLVANSLPPTLVVLTKQCIELDFNPKVFCGMPLTDLGQYPDLIGGVQFTEGIIGGAMWDDKLQEKLQGKNPTLPEFRRAYTTKWGIPPDQWGGIGGFAAVQILAQAIEKAGTLDRYEIKKVLDKERFDTAVGKTWFEKYNKIRVWSHCREDGPGNALAQWQGGEYRIIWPKEWATADILAPKPPWPK